MCIRAVADIRSLCNREIRSGRLADKLRHIRRQLVAFHLGKCSEENTIDLFKGMHHFQLGQKRNHLRNAAAHGFEEQDFSAEIRLKIRSGELQKTADISADHYTFHVIALQKCAREVEEAGRLPGKSVLEQSDLFGAVVVQQISNLIQHRLISSRSRDSIDNRREITVSPEALAGGGDDRKSRYGRTSFAISPPETSKISVISGSQ